MKVGPSIRTRNNVCPWCSTQLTAASEMGGDAEPSPGDLSVCVECGGLLAFTDQLRLRKATPVDLDDLDPEQRDGLLSAAAAITVRRGMH
jgi:hypothetical protein